MEGAGVFLPLSPPPLALALVVEGAAVLFFLALLVTDEALGVALAFVLCLVGDNGTVAAACFPLPFLLMTRAILAGLGPPTAGLVPVTAVVVVMVPFPSSKLMADSDDCANTCHFTIVDESVRAL